MDHNFSDYNGPETAGDLAELLEQKSWQDGVDAFLIFLDETDPQLTEPDFGSLVNYAVVLNNTMPVDDAAAGRDNLKLQLGLNRYMGEVSRFYMLHEFPKEELEEGRFLRMSRGFAQKTALQALATMKQQQITRDPAVTACMMDAVTFLERTKTQSAADPARGMARPAQIFSPPAQEL